MTPDDLMFLITRLEKVRANLFLVAHKQYEIDPNKALDILDTLVDPVVVKIQELYYEQVLPPARKLKIGTHTVPGTSS